MKNRLVAFALSLLIPSCSKSEVALQPVAAIKNNQKCEVYFYSAWTGYSHPVKMIGPLTYIEALVRGNYQRAWICEVESKQLFVLAEHMLVEGFEGAEIKSDARLTFFAAQEVSGGEVVKAQEISVQDTFELREFFVNVEQENGRSYSKLARQKNDGHFEYLYNPQGKLAKLRVLNSLGDLNELNY